MLPFVSHNIILVFSGSFLKVKQGFHLRGKKDIVENINKLFCLLPELIRGVLIYFIQGVINRPVVYTDKNILDVSTLW